MKKKKQIIFIRGGEAFYTDEQYYYYLENRIEYNPFKESKNWRGWISWALSDDFDIMEPPMPNKKKADYKSWKIFFEKLFPYLNDENLILIGSSLGGSFLVKYLSENTFPKHISQLHLVAPIFEDDNLVDEYLATFNFDKEKIKNIYPQFDNFFVYHSKNDHVVPFSHFQGFHKIFSETEKYHFFIAEDRGHFFQPALPELFNNIIEYEK